MQRKIIETGDGSKTLFIPEMDEQYHSVNGAFTESDYVFLQKGYRHHASPAPRIFEVGFGTGLNALLTAVEAERTKRRTTYVSIENFPLDKEITNALNYGIQISEDAQRVFTKIHAAEWEKEIEISEFFKIKKIKASLIDFTFTNDKNFDVIYFDAFGPDKQPDMWQTPIFNKIFAASANNSVFVTYSAKGAIRRQLRDCSYSMERLPGPPGKRQMLRGTKISSI